MINASENLKIFRLEEDQEELTELKNFKFPLGNIFDSRHILIFVDSLKKRVWIWNGKKSTPRMKFIAARKAPLIRDAHGIDFKILTADEGIESEEFISSFLNT